LLIRSLTSHCITTRAAADEREGKPQGIFMPDATNLYAGLHTLRLGCVGYFTMDIYVSFAIVGAGKKPVPAEFDNEVMSLFKEFTKNVNKETRISQPPLQEIWK